MAVIESQSGQGEKEHDHQHQHGAVGMQRPDPARYMVRTGRVARHDKEKLPQDGRHKRRQNIANANHCQWRLINVIDSNTFFAGGRRRHFVLLKK